MPSLRVLTIALTSVSLITAAPVPQRGSWWNHPNANWSPGSWQPWAPHSTPTPAAAPAPSSPEQSAPATVPSPSPAIPNSPESSAAPSVPSSPALPSSPASSGSPSSPEPSSPAASSPASSGGGGAIDSSFYPTPGDGSASAFHSFFDSKVVDFETLWSAWHSVILTNNNNDDTAVQWLHDAISSGASSSGLSASLLLSVIMQESSGIIAVGGTTDASGGASGGMMQCDGCPDVASLASATAGQVNAMISGGVAHFQGNMQAAGNDDWTALRLYNSGSLQGTDLSNPAYGPASTPDYVVDVANRMHGWIH